MIKLKLPGLGVLLYRKAKPPSIIYFESVVGNKDFSSIVETENSKYDFEYERHELTKQFELKQ